MAGTTSQPLVDSHCHLDLDVFSDDIDQVLQRALTAGIQRLHVPGTTKAGWHKQYGLSQQYACIDYSLGLHPYFLTSQWQSDFQYLELRFERRDNRAIAIGEIGLDAVIDVPYERQLVAFEKQLALASALKLPVILHHRKTQQDLLRVIKKLRFTEGGIVHAFSGSKESAMRFIEAGFLLGIGGTITYPRGSKTRETLKHIDTKHLVLETDSPDMPVYGKQGKRNEPENLTEVCEALSTTIKRPFEEVAKQTSENYLSLFSLNL
ncbi:TatD family hydrolase [Alteromonas sediminis]|uniref:TatD family hydrolase n=1 Tax=Alteromonas sediminis TaxID=2259342 RepID=UPI0014054404|nr:TatD family hydrolase [Alteromonas sediminis]